MPNYNKVILMGHLTRDPELSYTPTRTPVVNFGLAVNRSWKTAAGELRKEACFVDVYAYSNNAENLHKYTHKGDALHIEGRLIYNAWQTQDGTKRSRLKILIERFQFVTAHRKKPAGGDRQGNDSGDANNSLGDSPEGSPAGSDRPGGNDDLPPDNVDYDSIC